MANCCFQALAHIGIEADNGLLPQWVCAGRICGYRWHQASCQDRMASPSALTRCNPPAAICSSLEQSLVGMQVNNGNVFCLLGMLVSNACRGIFNPLRLTLVCASLDLKQVHLTTAGSINLGAGYIRWHERNKIGELTAKQISEEKHLWFCSIAR